MEFDCSGWATRNNIKCTDGRVIVKDAFKHDDGERVPLVWNHQHNQPENILGYAVLENRNEGVYTYCTFNGTENGRRAKAIVEHGDIGSFSIYANQLQQQGNAVVHGRIKEVSLVLAGANPGAVIENVISHGEFDSEAAEISFGEPLVIRHSDAMDSNDDDNDDNNNNNDENNDNNNNNNNKKTKTTTTTK